MSSPDRPAELDQKSWWEGPWDPRRSVRVLLGVNLALVLLVPAVQSWVAPWLAAAGWGHAPGIALGYSWFAMAVLGLSLAAVYRPFLLPLGGYMLGSLGQTAIFATVLLLCWGLAGVSLGIPNLIWDERPLGRLVSAMGATLLLALLGINAYYLGLDADSQIGRGRRRNSVMGGARHFLRRHGLKLPFGAWLEPSRFGWRDDEVNRRELSSFLRLGRLPFLVLISLPAMFPRVFTYVPWGVPRGGPAWPGGNVRADVGGYFFGLAVWGLGLLAGILLVKLALRFSAVMSDFREWMISIPPDAGGADPGPRWLGYAVKVVEGVKLGGFRQYLAVVVVVYTLLGLSSSKLWYTRGLAWLMLLALSLLQLGVAYVLRRRGLAATGAARRSLMVDARISLLVGVLVFCYGVALVSWIGRGVSAAFAIFALLGLLATAHAICVRREFYLVRWAFGAVLAALLLIVLARPIAGERITATDSLALVSLGSVLGFSLIRSRPRSTPDGGPPAWGLAIALSPFLAGIGLLAILRPVDLPALGLATAFWLVACATMEPPRAAASAAEAERRERGRWVLLTAAVGLWILLVNYDPYKMRFDALDYGPFVDRAVPKSERLSSKLKGVYPYDSPRTAAPAAPPAAPALLENRAVLGAWKEHVTASSKSNRPGMNPKLVVVCVSGGAIRSAYWSASVLKRLEEGQAAEGGDAETAIADFHDHVRVITGASGGMVGMAFYESALLRRLARGAGGGPPGLFDLRGIRPKSLNAVAGFIALQSPWRLLLPRLPGDAAYDRGRALEDDWGPLGDVTFAGLREAEERGRIPSMIFSPMIVEDGRRLLISNLDLDCHQRADRPAGAGDDAGRRATGQWSIPVSRQNDLDNDNDGRTRNQFSISALELFKLIPGSEAKLSLATAARMNATFPFVSPAVSLPVDPPIRVVDAAYYDNYGVNLACAWLLQNSEWLRCNTSGVLVVQTRDSVSKRGRVGVPAEAGGVLDKLLRGARFLTSVGDAVLNARTSTNAFRNDQELVAVNEVFRRMGAGEGFVATAVFENTAYMSSSRDRPNASTRRPWPGLDLDSIDSIGGDVPMSWYITEDELDAIERAIPASPNEDDYARILLNFKRNAAFFRQDGDFFPLRRALSFADVFVTGGPRLRAHDDYPIEDAKRAYGRFIRLAEMLEAVDLDDDAPSHGSKPPRAELEALGKNLLAWSGDPGPEARRLYERYFKQAGPLLDTPRGEDRNSLKRMIADAMNGPEFGHLAARMKDVLLYAHSEWLNNEAGLDTNENSPEAADHRRLHDARAHRTYYGREFERSMNYFRLRAIKSWWGEDHSTPRASRGSSRG